MCERARKYNNDWCTVCNMIDNSPASNSRDFNFWMLGMLPVPTSFDPHGHMASHFIQELAILQAIVSSQIIY